LTTPEPDLTPVINNPNNNGSQSTPIIDLNKYNGTNTNSSSNQTKSAFDES